ncbi:MAG TPA: hypothetical protein VJA27_02200 [Patescibacteria group bacterium]|nr:hypothetical protein [Patescibacteria group bacterium]
MSRKKIHFIKDLVILAISITAAVFLVKNQEIIDLFLHAFRGSEMLASFVAGTFFTSIFTTAPAMVALGEIAQEGSVLTTAFFGALGAVIGDLILFRFVRDGVSEDIEYLLRKIKKEKISLFRGKFFHLKIFRYLWPLIGALIIASPLPDELGLMILGLSKTKTNIFIPLSFSFNFLGILAIGLIARAI